MSLKSVNHGSIEKCCNNSAMNDAFIALKSGRDGDGTGASVWSAFELQL